MRDPRDYSKHQYVVVVELIGGKDNGKTRVRTIKEAGSEYEAEYRAKDDVMQSQRRKADRKWDTLGEDGWAAYDCGVLEIRDQGPSSSWVGW